MFRKSSRKHKKYMAYVPQLDKWVHFGDNRYEQYEDRTPLRLYARQNHHDPERRRLFKIRHENTRHVKYSPSWFADQFLW